MAVVSIEIDKLTSKILQIKKFVTEKYPRQK